MDLNQLKRGIERSLDLLSINQYSNDLNALIFKIQEPFEDAIQKNDAGSLGLFAARVRLMINRPSFGVLYRHKEIVLVSVITSMGIALDELKT